jgi:hypothetical protein
MSGVDPDIGSTALRLWVAAGSAALLVFVCALAFDWTRTRTVARIGVVVLGAVLGATLAWVFLDAASLRDQNAERRALETRAAELNAQILAPGSALACLDGLAGENVEAACEKALFAAPATVAAASSYVAARFSLLADMAAYSKRGGVNIDSVMLPLRRSLETDRFGFVAHTLAVRDGCSSDSCKALSLLHDASRVRANLSGQTLDRYLDHYVAVWAQASDVPVVDATPAGPGAPGQKKVAVDIDFPSAASIPPISIMNPEPKGSVATTAPAAVAAGAAGTAGSNANAAGAASSNANVAAATSAKRSRKQAATPPAQAAAAAPVVPAPPVDPVWVPGPAPAPQAAPPAAASIAPVGPAPVQLNPFAPPPQASAGGAARTQ